MRKKRLKRILLILASIYLVAGVILYFVQSYLIFPGSLKTVSKHAPEVRGSELMRISNSFGEVDAIFCRPFVEAESFPVLIFGHGNGEHIDGWVHRLEVFRKMGMAVLLVEYPGYGRSDGSPSEKGIREAMVHAYDRVVDIPGVDQNRIVGFGQSLGGGAICALARDRRLSVLVLQSTFTSLRPMTARYLMPSFLLRDTFDNAEVLANYKGPVLLVHGKNDYVVPFSHGVKLSRIAKNVEFKTYDCAHNCWTPEKFPIVEDIENFLKTHLILP